MNEEPSSLVHAASSLSSATRGVLDTDAVLRAVALRWRSVLFHVYGLGHVLSRMPLLLRGYAFDVLACVRDYDAPSASTLVITITTIIAITAVHACPAAPSATFDLSLYSSCRAATLGASHGSRSIVCHRSGSHRGLHAS